MLSKDELERLKDIELPNEVELVDVKGISIDMSLPLEQRMDSFHRQIKNPYCFKSGETVVRIKYAQQGKSLDDCVSGYLKSLKICSNP